MAVNEFWIAKGTRKCYKQQNSLFNKCNIPLSEDWSVINSTYFLTSGS